MKRAFALAICMALLVVATSCRSKRRHREPDLPPLGAPSWLVDLEVPGFVASKLAVPVGAMHPSAIVIALHGAADRPEWTCGELRGIVGPKPFVLCPSGMRRADFPDNDLRYGFGAVADTERELRAALQALKSSRFGRYLKTDAVTLAGFELGAQQAALVARQEPSFFARVLLIDPSPGDWSNTASAIFAERGGQRLLIACHRVACREDAALHVALTRRGGAEAELLDLGEPGPRLDPDCIAQLAKKWPWLQGQAARRPVSANGPAPARAAPSSR